MKDFEQIIREIEEKLTPEQIQLLKDTINYGGWGDTEHEFNDGNGGIVVDWAFGYCTNDAKNAGHFKGRQLSAMFRSMYQRLGMLGASEGCGRNEYFAYSNDYWGDGSGDMLFIRSFGMRLYEKLEDWAK